MQLRHRMEGRTLHVSTGLRPTDSPSLVYAAMAKAVPRDIMLAFGAGIVRELRQELHSLDKVAEWAVDLAIRLDRLVLLNLPNRDGSSQTVVLAPPAWTRERLAGFIAGRRSEIEEAYGPIDRIRAPGTEAA